MGAARPATRILLTALFGLVASHQAGASGPQETARSFEVEREGIRVRLSLEEPSSPAPAAELREARDVAFRFTITDTATGTPLSGIYPAAWMHLLAGDEEASAEQCQQQVEELIGGSLIARAELDLNVYYVLALNQDATITVVDPLFGFGGTKLLALISLASPGEDWQLSRDQGRLFVSQPEAGQVAAIDTGTWQVTRQIEIGENPRRLALQPDGGYLWVASGAGVAVVDARSLEVADRVATGTGPHDLAFSDDGRTLFVTNRGADTVSVIDTGSRTRHDLETGPEPVSVAFSPQAGAAWVSHRGDGSIVTIDARSRRVSGRIAAEPGLGRIRFTPGGRLALAVNPERDKLHVVDAARQRIVQSGNMKQGPERVAFSDDLAYIVHRDSEIVLMIPLEELGQEGAPLPVVDFPGGQEPFGAGAGLSPAEALVQAPGATAVLLANPADRMIYFYKEGMAAPMGGFRNYDRQPRAVLVVDRSLKERRQAGVYETVAKLRSPGRYQLAFFLDTPRIVHCFETEVLPDPELERQRRAAMPAVAEPLFESREVAAGAEVRLRYRLRSPDGSGLLTGLADVTMMAYNTTNWNQRRAAAEIEDGVYEAAFSFPGPGSYIVVVASPSSRLPFHLAPRRVLRVVEPASTESGR